ncbi:hypothetical protein AD16_2674 [Escherichia coli 3-267-03_S4_C2]|nr:hypothetical protein AD16_2674 [Escherichia coli 3-267-03_S4_C2]KEL84523.1 hypothetical protein AC22_2667 [Escherichia coli 5-366-08_S3_C2]
MDQGITLDGGGLSPLARGTPAAAAVKTPNPRFIPAGAGNTQNWFISRVVRPVYPRWRGEHAVMMCSRMFP